MTSNLFLSFIHDIFSILGSDFYEKTDIEKKSLLEKVTGLSVESKKSIANINSVEYFLKTVKDTLLFLEAEISFKKESTFLIEAYFNFIKKEVVPTFDKVSVNFFIASKENKRLLLGKIFSKNTLFFKTLCSFLITASNEETQEVFSNLAKKVNNELLIIQSARECNPLLKEEIRNKFGEKSFVLFQVNTRLLGGMLTYRNGKIIDSSWLGKVNSLKNIKV